MACAPAIKPLEAPSDGAAASDAKPHAAPAWAGMPSALTLLLVAHAVAFIAPRPRDARASRGVASRAVSSSAVTLLLVDDELPLRRAVGGYLESRGFNVTAVESAATALELLQRGPLPDVIVSDITMPQMDGYEFLLLLRSDPKYCGIPFVFLSARGMTDDRIQGYRAGCNAYLPKPFDPEELVSLVNNLLTQRGNLAADLRDLTQDLATIKGLLFDGQRSSLASRLQGRSPVRVKLTPKEQAVLNRLAKGLMNRDIATELDVPVSSVGGSVSTLYAKTGCSTRTELVRFALENDLITEY